MLLHRMCGSNNELDSKYSEVPNRRACSLRFFRFSFHPACNFSCCSFINLLSNKQAGWHFFFQTCSFIPVCSSIRDFRVTAVFIKVESLLPHLVQIWKSFNRININFELEKRKYFYLFLY